MYTSSECLCHTQLSDSMQRTLPFLQPLLTPRSPALRKYAHGLATLTLWLHQTKSSTPAHPLSNHTSCFVSRSKGVFQLKWQVRRKSTQGGVTAQEKEKQTKAPWHRQGSDVPPVGRPQSAEAMTRGQIKPRLLWPSKVDSTSQGSSLRHPHDSSS